MCGLEMGVCGVQGGKAIGPVGGRDVAGQGAVRLGLPPRHRREDDAGGQDGSPGALQHDHHWLHDDLLQVSLTSSRVVGAAPTCLVWAQRLDPSLAERVSCFDVIVP